MIRPSPTPDRKFFWISLAILIGFFGLGAYSAWDSLVKKPSVYETLEERGVRADARVEYGKVYALTVTFRGREYSADYRINYRQFEGVPEGSTVPVLVDPKDPHVIYTVEDVRNETNTGVRGVLIGIVFAMFGIGAFVYIMVPRD